MEMIIHSLPRLHQSQPKVIQSQTSASTDIFVSSMLHPVSGRLSGGTASMRPESKEYLCESGVENFCAVPLTGESHFSLLLSTSKNLDDVL